MKNKKTILTSKPKRFNKISAMIKMKNKKTILTSSKGLLIGASMLVPGVSGGTMAIILGIYDELIHSVNNIFKDFKKSFFFLLKFCIGAGIGFRLFAELILIY